MTDYEVLKELRIDRDAVSPQAHRAPIPRWIGWGGGIALAIIVAGGAAFAFHTRVAESADHVQTQQVQAVDATAAPVLQATGYVTARRQATVSAQITGTLTQLLIEEGDRVTSGQVVARLDDSAYKAALEAARAQHAAAQATLVQYREQLAQNIKDAARDAPLVDRGLVSRQAAEQSQTTVETARSEVVAQERQVDAAAAQVRQAQVNFEYCVIRAPFSGVVTTKDAQVGEIISPLSAGGAFTRTGVGTVVDMDSLELDVDVNEAYIGRLSSGMPTEAVLDAYPDVRFPSHVLAIVPAADRGKATVKVRVAFDGEDQRIVPDMGARVSFLSAKADATAQTSPEWMVPADAVVGRDGKKVVFIVAAGHARQESVDVVSSKDGKAVVTGTGMKASDRVVVTPPPTLHDASAVVGDADSI